MIVTDIPWEHITNGETHLIRWAELGDIDEGFFQALFTTVAEKLGKVPKTAVDLQGVFVQAKPNYLQTR